MNDREAIITAWVEKYSDILFSWALHKVPTKEVAEDLVQDTFVVAFQSFDKFEGRSSPKTWLFSILNNKVNDHHRKTFKNPTRSDIPNEDHYFTENEGWQANQQPLEWPDTHGNLLDDSEFKNTLDHCLKKLPTTWLSGVHLKYMEEKDSAHVCQELGITPTNFWQILHRAKLQVRKCLEIHWFRR